MNIRRLIHRDSAPILSFSGFGAKKKEERKKSDIQPPVSAPAQPAKQQPTEPTHLPKFYVKGINRDGAEKILEKQPVGVFLIRDRETALTPGSYTLSLRHKVCLKHHKIETHPTTCKLVIAGYERVQFDTLEQLTEFFIKTQKKDITLVPYDPDEVCSAMKKVTLDQPAYEEMEEDIHGEELYLQMDEGSLSEETQGSPSYENGPGPPPLPHRGRNEQQPLSYENLTRPKSSLPRHAPQTNNGYENIPEKGTLPQVSSTGASSAPPIPPRVAPSNSQGYENMCGKSQSMAPFSGSYENTPPRPSMAPITGSYENTPPRPSMAPITGSYENTPPRPPSYRDMPDRSPPLPSRQHAHGPGYENYTNKPTGYENYFSKKKATPPQEPSHGHSYQNLPPKVVPRRTSSHVGNFSAEQSLPPRKPVPLRRVKTDTQFDFNARRK